MPTSTSSAPIRLLEGLSAIADRYDVLLCDVWGVVHNGQVAYPEACAALTRFRAKGGSVVLITNAPRPHAAIFEQLARLNVPASAYDGMVTSGDVTLAFMKERGAAPLHHIGPARDEVLFDTLTAETGISPPRVGLDAAAYVVCTGLYLDDIGTPDDYADAFQVMKARNLDFISANPDIVVHVGDKEIYCAGALAQAYEAIGGRIFQAGKPHAPIYAAALAQAEVVRGKPLDRKRVLAIGDAMHTDVQGGHDAGLDVLFVTSGIHREELHPRNLDGEAAKLHQAALAQFLDGKVAVPSAAIPSLVW